MRLLIALKILFIALVYAGLAIVSLEFSFHSSNASPVWPASGFAFAILLLWRPQVAYGIFVGAFSANLYVFLKNKSCALPEAIWVSILIGAGNVLEALAGYHLLHKFIHVLKTEQIFRTVHSVYRFALTALFMCLVSSTIGSLSVFSSGIIPSSEFMLVWFTWWTGDVSGILLLSPLIIGLAGTFKNKVETYPAKLPETVVVFVSVIFMYGIVFLQWFHANYVFTRAFIITPFLIWAAIRLDQKIVLTLLFCSTLMALSGSLEQTGPFSNATLNESLITFELFVSINAVMVLLLQAAVMERRKHERYLNEVRANLEIIVSQRTKELYSKNRQLEKRNRELATFSHSASHDLREPLRKIEFFTNKILETDRAALAEEEQLISKIKLTTQRMIQLVENLLSYSLLEEHSKSLRQTDLNFVLSEVKHGLIDKIRETGATIHSDDLPVVNGVRSQLLQLFANILDNSIKFRKPQTPPEISIESEITRQLFCEGKESVDTRYFHLAFRDNGIGFEKEYTNTIFEILQKLHGQNEYDGSGVGLAICKRIVENHNGFICADSEPGIGTIIHVYLPVENAREDQIKENEIRP